MLTKFHEHRATSHKRTKGTVIRYPITFDTMMRPGGKVVRTKFTIIMHYRTAVIRAILQDRTGGDIKKATYHEICSATLAHMNAEIRNQ